MADSSSTADRMTKTRIYAAASVPEYWIVDLAGGAVDVYSDPDAAERRYRRRRRIERGDVIYPLAVPDAAVAVDDLLGPPPTS